MMTAVHLQCTVHNATLPGRATRGSFGFDLATVDEATIGPGETTVLASGLRLTHDLPHDETGGLAMLILPRSSLPLKHGLILPNSPGLVDADYSEPIGIIVHNLRDRPVTVPAGTRIAQAVFVEVRFPRLEEPPTDDATRNRSGFGSTG